MFDDTPVVLIASVSAHESRLLERSLESTGWTLLRVADAAEAHRRIEGGAGRAVLVIDAGLLATDHEPQWRALQSKHLQLGTVVRCLNPRWSSPPQADGRMFQVHPDDALGMRQAIQFLWEPALPGGSQQPRRTALA